MSVLALDVVPLGFFQTTSALRIFELRKLSKYNRSYDRANPCVFIPTPNRQHSNFFNSFDSSLLFLRNCILQTPNNVHGASSHVMHLQFFLFRIVHMLQRRHQSHEIIYPIQLSNIETEFYVSYICLSTIRHDSK